MDTAAKADATANPKANANIVTGEKTLLLILTRLLTPRPMPTWSKGKRRLY